MPLQWTALQVMTSVIWGRDARWRRTTVVTAGSIVGATVLTVALPVAVACAAGGIALPRESHEPRPTCAEPKAHLAAPQPLSPDQMARPLSAIAVIDAQSTSSTAAATVPEGSECLAGRTPTCQTIRQAMVMVHETGLGWTPALGAERSANAVLTRWVAQNGPAPGNRTVKSAIQSAVEDAGVEQAWWQRMLQGDMSPAAIELVLHVLRPQDVATLQAEFDWSLTRTPRGSYRLIAIPREADDRLFCPQLALELDPVRLTLERLDVRGRGTPEVTLRPALDAGLSAPETGTSLIPPSPMLMEPPLVTTAVAGVRSDTSSPALGDHRRITATAGVVPAGFAVAGLVTADAADLADSGNAAIPPSPVVFSNSERGLGARDNQESREGPPRLRFAGSRLELLSPR